MKTKEFSIRKRALSFRFAFDGVRRFFREEHNARIHLVATVIVFLAALLVPLSKGEVISLIIVTGFVWAAEIFNTAVEKIMNLVSPGHHPMVKVIKDLSAAGVLVASFSALICGMIIFIPKFF